MDPATGATVVTNLRLPGQYDERVLGTLGLQGPYYNWNRWYLPTVGRYLELDPIAMEGGFNTWLGVDWHNYAEGNPVRSADPWGLGLPAFNPVPITPANGPMIPGAVGPAGVAGAVAGGLAISAATVWAICAATGNYYDFCKFWFPPPDTCGGPKPMSGPPQPFPGWRPPFGPAPGGKCPPCIGPEEPPRIHTGHTHWPCPGTHVHYSVWEQDPKKCACFYKRDRVACL